METGRIWPLGDTEEIIWTQEERAGRLLGVTSAVPRTAGLEGCQVLGDLGGSGGSYLYPRWLLLPW